MLSARSDIDRKTYTVEEYARIYGISRSRAYDLARRDQLTVPVLRLGRRMLVSRDAVEDDLARRKGTGGEPAAA